MPQVPLKQLAQDGATGGQVVKWSAANGKWEPAADSGGGGSAFPVKEFQADQFEHPNNSDWAVNAGAELAADSNYAGQTVRLFDQTTEEGVGFSVSIPATAANLKLSFRSRAETGPAGARTVGLKLYVRESPDNVAEETWSAGTVLNDLDIPATDEFIQYDSQTIALSTLGLVAGREAQFELTRIAPSAGTNLEGDLALRKVIVEWT